MEVIPKLNRHFMPKALEVKPSGPPRHRFLKAKVLVYSEN